MVVALITIVLLMVSGLLFNVKTSLKMQCLSIAFLFILLDKEVSLSPYCFCSSSMFGGSLSLVMVGLSIWVSSMMMLVSLKYSFFGQNPSSFSFLVLLLLLVISVFFLTDSLLILYISFEASLIPTLLLILKWGYQPERLQASFYFIMYTVCASLPLLVMICSVSNDVFSFSMLDKFPMYLVGSNMAYNLVLCSFLMAFLVKVPMWGVHLWLPKAHVEAPVAGSMILAGILLKLGGYGLIRILSLIYKIHLGSIDFFFSVNLWGAVMVSLVCLSCTDMKSLIAYSSVVHMNLMVVGILKNTPLGVEGGILMMIAHGISSPGLFALASFNYDHTQTRNIVLQKGIGLVRPSLMLFWFLLIAANMAAPPSLGLVSEILICVSVLKVGFLLFFIFFVTTFASAGYNLYLYSCQQGSSSKFILPGGFCNSVIMLVGVMHCFPVFGLVLGVPLLF